MRTICRLFLSATILFCNINIFAQVALPAGLVVRGIGALVGGNKEKKQEKTIEKSESKETVNGTAITILRVKDADIKSKAKASIIKIQNRLDEYAELCKSGAHLNIPKKDSDIYNIQTLDSDWPTAYYENELKAYKKYELKLVLKEQQHTKDSLASINSIPIKTNDSLFSTPKFAAGNVANKNIITNTTTTQGYSYLNKAFAIVKESPADNAKTLGVLYVGSYVKLANPDDKSQFVKISFSNNQGFIDKSFLVDNIDKITVANADLNTYKKSVYCRYMAKP